MNDRCFALLAHDRLKPLDALKSALKDLSVETYSFRSCEGTKRLIPQTQPLLVFTDTVLPEASWTDVIKLAENAGSAVTVIVVGTNKDVKFYLTTLERGAFDFVLPPFENEALDFIVQSVSRNARCHGLASGEAAILRVSHRRSLFRGHRDSLGRGRCGGQKSAGRMWHVPHHRTHAPGTFGNRISQRLYRIG